MLGYFPGHVSPVVVIALQDPDVPMMVNDEFLMTNDERMTKPE